MPRNLYFEAGSPPASDRGTAECDVHRAAEHQDKEESEGAQCKGGDGDGDGEVGKYNAKLMIFTVFFVKSNPKVMVMLFFTTTQMIIITDFLI